MLAPIITKDMKLFPTQSLPPKNVRYRAHSLNELSKSKLQSRNTVLSASHQRTSQSVDQLPINSSRSLLKSCSMRKPTNLDAIVEGVEMSSNNSSNKCAEKVSTAVLDNTTKKGKILINPRKNNKDIITTNNVSSSSSQKSSFGWPKCVVKRFTGMMKSKSKSDTLSKDPKVRKRI